MAMLNNQMVLSSKLHRKHMKKWDGRENYRVTTPQPLVLRNADPHKLASHYPAMSVSGTWRICRKTVHLFSTEPKDCHVEKSHHCPTPHTPLFGWFPSWLPQFFLVIICYHSDIFNVNVSAFQHQCRSAQRRANIPPFPASPPECELVHASVGTSQGFSSSSSLGKSPVKTKGIPMAMATVWVSLGEIW